VAPLVQGHRRLGGGRVEGACGWDLGGAVCCSPPVFVLAAITGDCLPDLTLSHITFLFSLV